MTNIKMLVLISFFCLPLLLSSQNNDTAKLRIILIEKDSLFDKKLDSAKVYLFSDDILQHKLTIENSSNYNLVDENRNLFYDVIIPSGNYTVIIDGITEKSLLFTNVKLKRNKMNYLPINVCNLNSIGYNELNFIVKDYNINLMKYLND